MSEPTETIEIDNKPYVYYEQKYVQKNHHYYLNGEIVTPDMYVDMIHQIRTAIPEDVITIHLNTPGGDLTTGVQIINAIKVSAAHVICSLEGEAHSLGSLIFLAADEFVVHDNVIMLIHNYSSYTFGKGNEQVSEIAATKKWFEGIAREYYTPFITETELKGLLKDEDIWLHSDEIRTRVEKMIKQVEKDRKIEEKNQRR